MLGREVESRYPSATDVRQEDVRSEGLDSSVFSVLRRGDVNEDKHEEVQRREDEVEHRLEG